jgi:NADH:ubiquinone oxidoreductase subunit 3 (subunit A)
MLCRHYLYVVIIKSQLRLLRTLRGLIVYPDYRVIIVSVALITKARCVVVALMAAHALTPDARACTRVDCGGLFKPLKPHHSATFINNFIWLYILFIVLCDIIYLYILPSGHNNYIKLYIAWTSGKLN